MNNKIDFVLTWVDGNDEKWRKNKSKYDSDSKNSSNNNSRYRDWELLKYWFRGVEQYAPWINKIYFVTCGQKPEWLNENHPKLVLVNHKDYMPKKYLPTFSSHPIELNLHRIESLSEQFVYFNDDVFIINNVQPSDFFKNGLPLDDYVETALLPYGNGDYFPYIMFNNSELINKHFNKKDVLMKKTSKFLNIKYGVRNNLKNISMLGYRKYSSFAVSHQSSAFLKSTFEILWNKEKELLNKVCCNKFRTKNDVNQYIFKYWQYCTHKFIPRKSSFGKFMTISEDNRKVINTIKKGKYKTICINDSEQISNFEKVKKELTLAFEEKLPNKSSFEK